METPSISKSAAVRGFSHWMLHDHLLGLAADQLLVQPHKQGQGVVDGAEGDGCDWGAVGGEVEDVLVGVGVLP